MTSMTFMVQGPDFVWHLDGYDKLKPYGFPIHGCIDGLVLYNLKLMITYKLYFVVILQIFS